MLLKTYCEVNVIHYYQLKQPFLLTHVEWFTTDSYDQYAKNWFAITTKNGYIPLISRVFGPYCKLRTEFFSIDLWPKREARGP